MNTAKQINVMLGLLMVFVIATTLYFVWDRQRENDATARQLATNAERGGALFALNCRSCHGLTGRGALERAGLPGAPLNVEGNRATTVGDLTTFHTRFGDTIKCGRVGTVMPPWSVAQGGSLNDFQIQQLLALITGTMPGFDIPDDPNAISEEAWAHALEEANHADAIAFDPRKELEEAVGEDDTTLVLNDASELKADDSLLRLDDDPTDEVYEIVLVTDVDEESGEVQVERGASGTDASAHEAGIEVLIGQPLPEDFAVTGSVEPVPCGQSLAQPEATPGPPVEVSGDVSITMGDNFFDLDGQQNPTLAVAAGDEINVSMTNDGTQIHNMRVNGADAEYETDDDEVSDPETVAGGATAELSFSFDEAGTYAYQCDFHPADMAGEIVVE